MGKNSNGKVKDDDLLSAEEKMALLLGPRSEQMRKKRVEEAMHLLFIINEDSVLQRRLLAKLEQNTLAISKSSESMDWIGKVHDLDGSQAETTADNEVIQTMNASLTSTDEAIESKQEIVEHNQQPEPVKWVLRIVEGIAKPKTRSRQLKLRNRDASADYEKKKSVKLNFSVNKAKDEMIDSIGCQQMDLKEEQSMHSNEEGNSNVTHGESVPEPMTPPCTIIQCCDDNSIPSPKTPPMQTSYRSQIKNIFERREKEGTMRLLDVITLDGDEEW